MRVPCRLITGIVDGNTNQCAIACRNATQHFLLLKSDQMFAEFVYSFARINAKSASLMRVKVFWGWSTEVLQVRSAKRWNASQGEMIETMETSKEELNSRYRDMLAVGKMYSF